MFKCFFPMYPLGHRVSLTSSMGITSFGEEAESEKRLLATESCEAAAVRRRDGTMHRWTAAPIMTATRRGEISDEVLRVVGYGYLGQE